MKLADWFGTAAVAAAVAAAGSAQGQTYTVTVENGTADRASAAAGETVQISADAPASGTFFYRWTSDDVNSFDNAAKATTTFMMPDKPVKVTANYEDVEISDIDDQPFTGNPIEPEVRVFLNGVDVWLVAGRDYNVSYSNNKDVGEATATVELDGDYWTGGGTATFQITQASIEGATVSAPDESWSGGPPEPVPTVVWNGIELTPDTDFTVTGYEGNDVLGTATVIVEGKGNLTGRASGTFRIVPDVVVEARQRWPWNGLVDVDYMVLAPPETLPWFRASIAFEERGGEGRRWEATKFLAGAEPSVGEGWNRATWDARADGAADVVADDVVATVSLLRMPRLTVSLADGFGVPVSAGSYEVTLYDGDGNQVLEPMTVPIAGNGPPPEAVFDWVPLGTSSAHVDFLNARHGEVVSAFDIPKADFPELDYGADAVAVVRDEGETVTVNIVNAYAMDTEKADVRVCFNDGLEKRAHFSGAAFDKDAGACTVAFKAASLEGSVSSAELLCGGIPFEWLDYAAPQAFPGGGLDLDVAANEFANGAYDASGVMQVANPRHLDNVRYHLDGSFRQIKDIDFAGSCGISNAVTVSKSAQGTEIVPATFDSADGTEVGTGTLSDGDPAPSAPRPRFYGGPDNVYGWRPIGDFMKTRYELQDFSAMFCGTYDGGGYGIAHLVSSVDTKHYPGNTLSGLFGNVTGTADKPAVIENVTIADSCSFFASCSSGPVLGSAYYWVTIRGCKTAGDVYAYYYAAGIAGQAGDMSDSKLSHVTIENCTANGRIYADDGGGIVGWFSYGTLKLSGCVFGENGTITAENGLGGLMYNAGINSGDSLSVSNCHARGTLSVPANQGIHVTNSSGGLLAILYGQLTLSKCTMSCAVDYFGNTANAVNTRRVGGIVGYASDIDAAALKSIFTGNVTVPDGFMSEDISEANHIGTYCGRPWLDSLE